jgi:hypothetical protein
MCIKPEGKQQENMLYGRKVYSAGKQYERHVPVKQGISLAWFVYIAGKQYRRKSTWARK